MRKRLWIYLRRGFFALGRIMGRKPLTPLDFSVGLVSLCLLMGLPILASISVSGWREWRRASWAHIEVPVKAHSWKALRTNAADPESEELADPANPGLWESKTQRDPLSTFDSAQRGAGSVLWLGTRFGEQELAHAFYVQANVLYLGQVSGRFRVFIDGEPVLWGSSFKHSQPIVIPMSTQRLENGKPLYVAIEIATDAGAFRPDELGGKVGEGFVTSSTADTLIEEHLWETQTQPLLCTVVLFTLGCVFFMSWLTHRRKQEYAVFAAYALHQALIQMGSVELVHALSDFRFWNRLGAVLLVWEGAFGMFLGFSFARARGSWTVFVAAVASVASFFVFAIPASPSTIAHWQHDLFAWYLPLAYARGAIACWIQWSVLSQKRKLILISEASIKRRRMDLRRLGLGLILVGAFYGIESVFFASSDPMMSFFRLVNFGVLLAFFGVGIIEDRLKIQKTEDGSAPEASTLVQPRVEELPKAS